jgi:hypothetical protein
MQLVDIDVCRHFLAGFKTSEVPRFGLPVETHLQQATLRILFDAEVVIEAENSDGEV